MVRPLFVVSLSTLCLTAALWFWRSGVAPALVSDPIVLVDDYFTYQLHQPDATATLERDLDEVSGVAWVDEQTLAMVNDEDGLIFLWDTPTESVRQEIDFGKSGDYEGLALSDEASTIFVLRSDGDVYEVRDFKSNPHTIKHENSLSSDNDTEGLAYDTQQRALLIACKASGAIEGKKGLKNTLAYRLSLSNFADLNPLMDAKKRISPSGLAVHPVTHHYYLLSSRDRQLVVYDRHHNVLQQIHLPKALLSQPEGICFSPGGTLFLTSEARGQRAQLLRFEPQKQP